MVKKITESQKNRQVSSPFSGHLFCWACLHQWLNATAAGEEAWPSAPRLKKDDFSITCQRCFQANRSMSPSSSQSRLVIIAVVLDVKWF